MKKLLLPIVALAMLFIGCAKEVEEQSPADRSTRTEAIQQPLEFSNQTLSFISMAQLDAKVAELKELTYEDRQAWLDGQSGFLSMQDASWQINDQMKICPNLDNVLALREAYADLFVFDPSTVLPVNAAPYYKVSKSGYEWVCNAYGEVEVGGQVLNLTDITSYAQTWRGKADNEAILARNPATRAVNTLTITNPSNSRTVMVTMRYSGGGSGHDVYMRFETGTIINNTTWIHERDVVYVSYVENRTEIKAMSTFSYQFNKLKQKGAQIVYNTQDNGMVNAVVGTTSYSSFRTCYLINSSRTAPYTDYLEIALYF